jgi:hypothetical protein
MEVNIPPVATVLGGLVFIGACFVFRIPIFIVGLLSLVFLVYTIILNRNLFENEYKNMTIMKSIASLFNSALTNGFVSIILVVTIIILALGYILYIFGASSFVGNAPMQMPSISAPNSYSTPQSQYRNYNSAQRNSYISAFNRAI